ncbi:MAG: SWIM zinc finger family protein [Blastocatellia bacterium]|nr:SWIM zinc finger family protein [Blastocatellia bacterium]
MTAFKLTEAVIRASVSETIFERGQQLWRSGAISQTSIQGSTLSGECEGTQSPFYQVRAELDEGGIRSAACTCPYDFGGHCKHIVALLLAYAESPERFAARQDTAKFLAGLSREQLLALLVKLLGERPEFGEWIEASIAQPTGSAPRQSSPAQRRKIDTEVHRHRVRSIMHSLDHMRTSEAYWHVGGLVDQLRGVEETAMEFLAAGDAEAALRILITLLEESHEGFDYIDDSDGELGGYFSELGESLAEVILSLDLDKEGREEILSDLEEPHRNLCDYGVDGLEIALAAARYGWKEMPGDEHAQSDDEDYEDEEYEFDQSVAQVLTRARLNVLERQGRVDDYLALCLQTGAHLRYALKLCALDRVPEAVSYAKKHLSQADEALKLAEHLRESGHIDEAIMIGEFGLKLDGRKSALGQWLAPIEEAQGRTAEALAAWLAAFHDSPSLALWKTLKRLAGERWKKLRPEAISSLEKSWNSQELAEVLLFEEEWDVAIKVADEHKNNYHLVATVADAVISHNPEWVIRASLKQAEDLIVQTKSNLYPHAADWLRRAKAAYTKLGRTGEWQKYLQELKEEYRRRPALQAQLARL